MSHVSPVCWARGRVVSLEDLRIGTEERAFRYGDGVFATIRLHEGALFEVDRHLARLATSAAAVGLAVPGAVSRPEGLGHIVRRLCGSGDATGVVRIQVSAGPGGRGFGRPEGEGERPAVAPAEAGSREGAGSWELVELHAAPLERRLAVAVLESGEVPLPSLPAVKSCSALPHVLCAAAAARRGMAECVRVADGVLLEAAAANLFWSAGECLYTPAASLPLYPGVTRSVVLEVARREGWEVREVEHGPAELARADGAFLTNAARGLEPIAEIDGRVMPWPDRLEALRRAVWSARLSHACPVESA